jgi:hypothetical protein
MNEVCLPIWRANLRVVHIGKHHLQIVDCTVHALKHLHSIGQHERGKEIFEKAKWGNDCCFWDILCRDRGLVIAFHHIDF